MKPMITDLARKRVTLLGIFGSGNLGNECTLWAMLHNLRRWRPDAQISCICTGPEVTASTYNILASPIREMPLTGMRSRLLRWLRRIIVGIPVELYRWASAIKKSRNSHMLIITGTGMLTDVGMLPFGLHYDLLKWSIAAKLCRRKLLFVSVGVGPIRHPLSRFFIKTALRLADYRSYRDRFSKDYLEGIGFKTNGDAIYPDLAFSLPRGIVPSSRKRENRRGLIGVGLITHNRKRTTSENDEAIYKDYIKKVAAFVGWLLERKYTVRLLIGDVAYDMRARQDLKALLERNGWKFDGIEIVDEPAHSVDQLLSQLVETDVVIASRFHNVLLALMLGKPVVAISFHEKVDSLMSAVGLTEFCQDIENIDLEKLTAQFAALKEHTEYLKLQVQQKTESYRRALDRQYEDIFGAATVHESAAGRS